MTDFSSEAVGFPDTWRCEDCGTLNWADVPWCFGCDPDYHKKLRAAHNAHRN